MKAIYLILLLIPLNISAQQVKLDKYPSIPEEMMAVFCDYCAPFHSGIAKALHGGRGQYIGQLTPDNHIYGFGQYIMDNETSVTGLFRMTSFIFGIKMGTHIVKVGSDTHYISYDLTTSEPISIMKDGEIMPIPEREGYGLYHYKDGGFFFGRYHENEPYGYGAVFTTEATIKIVLH